MMNLNQQKDKKNMDILVMKKRVGDDVRNVCINATPQWSIPLKPNHSNLVEKCSTLKTVSFDQAKSTVASTSMRH